MDGKSLDIAEDKKQQLKQLFPEVFSEDQIDFEKLKLALGEDSLAGAERYELNWPGKYEAFKEIQKQTTATLIPDREGSVNFDTSENIFIEGENLEVLRVLQKSYYGKIKMIYIDPPYNTGNDHFVYPDDFAERREEYEKRSGIKDENGFLNKQDLWKKNTKENGQFHSVWLSMMYPRLYLARNLLREDGIIFISIDDTEEPNLRLVLDSIYGSENYLGSLVIDRNRKNDARFFSIGHEYMLVYAKNKQLIIDRDIWLREPKEGIDQARSLFRKLVKKHSENWDNIQEEWRSFFREIPKSSPVKKLGRYAKVGPRGPYRDDGNISWPGGSGPKYEVLHPETGKPCKVPDGGWRYSKPERFWEEVNAGRVVFGPDETTLPRQIRYLFDSDGQVMQSVFYSYAQTATMDFIELMGARVFDNPKYWKDIARMIRYTTADSDIILDFFSGSGTTAHAVLNLNAEEGTSRRFICVQMPEEVPEGSDAQKEGYSTIADIAKDRIRKVMEVIEQTNSKDPGSPELFQEHSKQDDNLGFKSFRLSYSNFKTWQSDIEGKDAILDQLDAFQDRLKEQDSEGLLVYELLLKSGLPLTAKIETRTGIHEEEEFQYNLVEDGVMLLALSAFNSTLISEIIKIAPQTVVTLDSLFEGDDAFMTNTHLQLQEVGIDFKVI